MHNREQAEILFRKGKQDEYALGKLIPDPAVPDEILGFHAQQAVEKMLKAVLSWKDVPYRRTHDLTTLLTALRGNNIPFPHELYTIRELNPFAASLRYDDPSEEPERALDRSWALNCVRKVRAWAESILGK